ncbi:MAG: alginate lyase family protein [Bryobacterales bacterium]|nr:alginate lyase family protein [Bryobacterales bacterium]
MLLYFHTVRHLKPEQVLSRFTRRRPRLVHRSATPLSELTRGWLPSINRPDPEIAPRRFRFLNESHTVSSWNDSHLPKLWLYNLHYFDHPTLPLIQAWIDQNPIGHGNGWEPYPLSLRIVNWIKFALGGTPLPTAALDSLAQQGRYLYRSLEYHLLANHLFANAKALTFAGSFFTGPEAAAWRSRGLQVLAHEISEQILADGGHFERSPMYHCLILEDLLDLINLANAFDAIPVAAAAWREAASRMLGWLQSILHPDGDIPFFNDTALGIAPRPDRLFQYARSLGVQPLSQPLKESGYYRLENERAVLLIDAAPIGPDYQPGHAHADALSFELSLDNQRVIVNSGTSTYDNNALRHRQRSTSAHNTVAVDRQSQSEVWAAFRVARRARPFNVQTDRSSFLEASHNGYQRLSDPVIHRRRFALHSNSLTVTDYIEARGPHQVEIYFHFHPDANPRIDIDPTLTATLMPNCWYPEFNKSVPNQTLRASYHGPCPVGFTNTIHF